MVALRVLIICALSFAHTGQSLHLRTSNDDPSIGSRAVLEFYMTDPQIERVVDSIVSEDKGFKKSTCPNDDNYRYLTITSSEGNHEDRKNIVISCNIHARELLVSEVCIKLIQLLHQYNTDSAESNPSPSSVFSSESVRELLNNTQIVIFYRGNDQRDKVIEDRDFCIRKNRNDIDLNRNFPTGFNLNNYSPSSQQYPGDEPLSEPYSQCLDNKLQSINSTHNKLTSFLDIHTGEFTLFDSFVGPDNRTESTGVLQTIKSKYCPQCRITSQGDQFDGQVASGEIFSDVKARYHPPHSVLFEVYGGNNQNLGNNEMCFTIFNPLTERELEYYKLRWSEAIFEFLLMTSSNERY